MYDKPDSQYSQLVMALRKAETETLGSSVSEARAKSAVVGSDTSSQEKGASSESSYEVLTQQIAYLMAGATTPTNQNSSKVQNMMVQNPVMEMVSIHTPGSKSPKGMRKI